MPGYFWKTRKHNISEFQTNIMEGRLVTEQCRLIFNIKGTELTNMDLFIALGFHNIYGIVSEPDAGTDMIKSQQLESLNALCTAETLTTKRQLFIAHCKQFTRKYLTEIDEDTLSKFEPVLRFCETQIENAFHTVMGKKKRKHAQDFEELRLAIGKSLLIETNINEYIRPRAGVSRLKNVIDILSPFLPNGSKSPAEELQAVIDEVQGRFDGTRQVVFV